MIEEHIPPTRKALAEALELSSDILRNIELSELPLENIALKTGRLARLLNDFEMQKIIQYEVGGYPTFVHGLPQNIYNLAVIAGRQYEKKSDDKQETIEKFIYGISIRQIEEGIKINEIALNAAGGSRPEP